MNKVIRTGIGVSLIALGTFGTVNVDGINEAKAETVSVKSSNGSKVNVNKLRVFVVKDKVEGSNIQVEDKLKGASHFFSTQQVKAEDLGMVSVPSKLPISPNKVNYGKDNVYEYYQVMIKEGMKYKYNITNGLTKEDLKGLELKGVYKYNVEGNTLKNGVKVNNNVYELDSKLNDGEHALVLFVKTSKESITDTVDGLKQGNKTIDGMSLKPVKGDSGLEITLTVPQLNTLKSINSCKELYTTYGIYNIPKKLSVLYNDKLDINKDGVMCNLSNQPNVNNLRFISIPDLDNVKNTDTVLTDIDGDLLGTVVDGTEGYGEFEPDVEGGINPELDAILGKDAAEPNPIETHSDGDEEELVIDYGKEGYNPDTKDGKKETSNNSTGSENLGEIQKQLDGLSNKGNGKVVGKGEVGEGNKSNLNLLGSEIDTNKKASKPSKVYNLPDTGETNSRLGVISVIVLCVGLGLLFKRRGKADI